MTTAKDIINAGEITDAKAWIESSLKQAHQWGFPFVALASINSDVATALLERNTRNRPLRMGRALRYRHDMENGLWVVNGETLIVASDGAMISGQHRCEAIRGTDLSIQMLVTFGVAPESDVTVDQGAPKTAGDYLAMQGEANARTLAKIARLRLAYEANEGEALKDTARPTNADVLRFVSEHKEDVERSAALATELREYTKPIAAPSVVGFVHNVLHDIDAEPADIYINQVAKGEDIKEGDPAFAVRTRLLNMGKMGSAKKAGVMFTGWNAFHTGRTLKTVRVSDRLPVLV